MGRSKNSRSKNSRFKNSRFFYFYGSILDEINSSCIAEAQEWKRQKKRIKYSTSLNSKNAQRCGQSSSEFPAQSNQKKRKYSKKRKY